MDLEERIELLHELKPELDRFTKKIAVYENLVKNPQTTTDFEIGKAWRSLQRATVDLRDTLRHITSEPSSRRGPRKKAIELSPAKKNGHKPIVLQRVRRTARRTVNGMAH
jgi:hypothetical protein